MMLKSAPAKPRCLYTDTAGQLRKHRAACQQ